MSITCLSIETPLSVLRLGIDIPMTSNIEASASTVRDARACFEPTGIESSHYPRDYPSYSSRYSPGSPGSDSMSSYDTSPVISACLQSDLRYSRKRPFHRHLFSSAMICVSKILDYSLQVNCDLLSHSRQDKTSDRDLRM